MHLSKHHGLGNDFLIIFADVEDPAGLARRLCHRRLGLGADGLVVARSGSGDADLVMQLRNADGSRAEMSGNGIRCLAQAEARRRQTDTVDLRIATDAGLRAVAVRPGPDPATVTVRVDMGPAKVRLLDGPSPGRAAEVDMGNPHLVLLDDGERLDPEALGREHADVNIELVTVRPDGQIAMRVWERGVGHTEACGTGACAAAAAAHEWGLVPAEVTVSMPGGVLEVTLGDTVTLVGPATHVADIEIPA
jgi:diaminopimelate epimerase